MSYNHTNSQCKSLLELIIAYVLLLVLLLHLNRACIMCYTCRFSKMLGARNNMRGSRKFCQRNQTLTTFFLFGEGREDLKYHYKQAITGPPAKRHLNGPTLDAVLAGTESGSVLLRNPIALWFFRVGPETLSTPSGPAHAAKLSRSS